MYTKERKQENGVTILALVITIEVLNVGNDEIT